MFIRQDKNGFILEFYTFEDMKADDEIAFRIIDHAARYTECPNFPKEDFPEAWEHFKQNYRYYTFTPISKDQWDEYYFSTPNTLSEQILAQFVYHPELQ